MSNLETSNITVPVGSETPIDTTYDIRDQNGRNALDDIEAYIGYPDNPKVIGVNCNFDTSTFTRLGAARGKVAGSDFDAFNMFKNRKLCNLADDGTVNAWYGENGYVEDGSNGQVMIYQPKFYYKTVPIKILPIDPEIIDPEAATPEYTEPEGYHLVEVNYYISDEKLHGFKVHPAFLADDGVTEVNGIYISAYEGSVYDVSAAKYLLYDDMSDDGNYTKATYIIDTTADKFCSIAGVKPASGLSNVLTRPAIEAMCQNRGSRWHSENLQVQSMEQLLYIIENAGFNSQSITGAGVTGIADVSTDSCTVQTGATASLGNGSGVATATTMVISSGVTNYTTTDGLDKMSVRYRGRENDWGNMYHFTNGLNINGNGKQRGGIPYICSDHSYEESKKTDNYKSSGITVTNGSGYIKYFGWSPYCDWAFLPTYVGNGGDSTKPVGDYIYVTANLNSYRIASLGGRWSSSAGAGAFSWAWYYGVGARARYFGGRLFLV